MGVAPTANVSTSNLAYNIPNYLCTNFGAFIKKCTIDQLIRYTNPTQLELAKNKGHSVKLQTILH